MKGPKESNSRNDRRPCHQAARQDLEREPPPLADVRLLARRASVPGTRPEDREDAVEDRAGEGGDVHGEADVEEGVEERVEGGGLDGLARRGGGGGARGVRDAAEDEEGEEESEE